MKGDGVRALNKTIWKEKALEGRRATKVSNEPDSVRFIGLETKPNHLLIIKTEPNCLKFMKPLKPNRLEPNCLNQTV